MRRGGGGGGGAQEVAIQAGLGDWYSGLTLRADSELEVAHVVGRDVCGHRDGLADGVAPDDDSPVVVPTGFPSPRLPLIPGITADATSALVAVPLATKAPAVGLMVVVVRRRGEAEAPGGGAGGRLHEAAMGGGELDQGRHPHDQQHLGRLLRTCQLAAC